MSNYYSQYLDLLMECDNNIRDDRLVDFTLKHGFEIWEDYRKYKPRKEYKYMLTFTLDDSKVTVPRETYLRKIEAYIVRLLDKPENFRFYYSNEHRSTNCHWHVIIHRYERLKSDKLTYYRKNYGFVHQSKSFILEDQPSVDYLGKENQILTVRGPELEIEEKMVEII